MRLIDADALLAEIDAELVKTDPKGEEQIGVLKCRRLVRTAPTISPESLRPKGRWEETDWVEYDGHGECVHYHKAGLLCVSCRHVFKKKLLYKDNFCPNCGADMRGDAT